MQSIGATVVRFDFVPEYEKLAPSSTSQIEASTGWRDYSPRSGPCPIKKFARSSRGHVR